jgi:hypothetical protein
MAFRLKGMVKECEGKLPSVGTRGCDFLLGEYDISHASSIFRFNGFTGGIKALGSLVLIPMIALTPMSLACNGQ